MVCNVGDDSFLQIDLWGAKTEGYSLRIGGGGHFFLGVIIIIICHSGLNKIAMGGSFFLKRKQNAKKFVCHTIMYHCCLFFLVLEHVFVFFISIKIHKFCLGIFLSFFHFFFFAHFVKIQRRSSHSSIILLTSVFFSSFSRILKNLGEKYLSVCLHVWGETFPYGWDMSS